MYVIIGIISAGLLAAAVFALRLRLRSENGLERWDFDRIKAMERKKTQPS